MCTVPKFIYFDLDDTLLDHKRAERRALHDINRHFDLFQPAGIDELIRVYQAVNSKQWALYSRAEVSRDQLQRNRFKMTLKELGLDESKHREVGDRYMQFYRNHWEWVEGAEAGFQAISTDYEVGILTNGFTETQKAKFDRFDLYEYADHLVISEEIGALKPHPSVFDYATRKTGYNPEEILYIGDSYHSDVVGGSDFGWKVAWFTQNGEAEKRKTADFIFNDFSDLKAKLQIHK